MTTTMNATRQFLLGLLLAGGCVLAPLAVDAQGRPADPPGTTAGGPQSGAAQRQQQRQVERAQQQQQSQDHARMQDRTRERTHEQAAAAPGAAGIYGGNLMTAQEREQYRARLRELKTEQERTSFEAEHRTRMQARGRERGIEPVLWTE